MLNNDTKYIIISFILHLAVAYAVIHNSATPPEAPTPIEVTMSEGTEDKGQIEKEDNSVVIIPKGDTENPEENSDNGYFGIGITTQDHFVNGIFVVEVLMVSYGYPADLAGIVAGDKIIEVNGEPVRTGQEIRGTKKDSLTLKIIRADGTMTFIRLTRDFIRTKY